MSNHKGIKGFQVQTRTEDPVPFAQEVANNPYQGVWSSGGSLNTGRYLLAGDGQAIPTTFAVGGTTSTYTAVHEQYNGSAWTEVADLNTARYVGWGVGQSNTAALGFGGYSTPAPGSSAVTELWNGSSWTELNDMNTARYAIAGGGITTSALAFGGFHTSKLALNESWNGTSWTEVGD